MAAYTTIDNPELYFQNKIYSGDGNDDRGITLDGSENMQPDIVWIAERNTTSGHMIYDSQRGASEFLFPYSTRNRETSTARFKSFDSDGFTVGTSGASNGSSDTYVAWCWKESATAGMDIVLYTGDGSSRTISHSLSAVPDWMIVKNREFDPSDVANGTNWDVWHSSLTATSGNNLLLNTNAAEASDASKFNSAPTSSVFGVNTNNGVNKADDLYFNYLWSAKQGYSKFGSYTGNGNADGPFIYLGFRPAFLIYKSRDTVKSWYINDNKRDPHNPCDGVMLMDASDAENASHGNKIDFLSNGFKSRSTGSTVNSSGAVYVYMAFSESPFVNSKGVPTNAR
tara:strand:- start:2 stop:1021 length:1020 start_codon:yes stop_codon:yes gene_type:complete